MTTAEDWMNDHPEETTLILDTIARRTVMSSWKSLHPIAHEFQRKVVLDMAEDIIAVVIGEKKP